MIAKLGALAGLLAGLSLILMGGGEAPRWLQCLQVAFFCAAALLYGFTAFSPSAPAWLSSRPVVGVAMLYMGVAVMFVPANIVTSAFFIGTGTRLVLAPDIVAVRVSKSTGLARRGTGTTVEVQS